MNEPQSGQLLFDAFGTLIYPEPDAASVYVDFGRQYGDQRPAETIRELFGQHLANAMASRPDCRASESIQIKLWKNIVQAIFGHLPQWGLLFRELWLYFSEPQHWRVYADVADTLKQLKQNGASLGIASNFDSRLHSIIRGLPPLKTLDHVFISAELGWRKPSAQFFQAIAKQLPASNQPIWMIGDDWDLDIVSAQACGWNGVYLDRHQTEPKKILPNRTICIDSLRQLPALMLP